MKIAYVDFYTPNQSPYKDPVTIPTALSSKGRDVTLIACNPIKPDFTSLHDLPVKSLDSMRREGWAKSDFDTVIFCSRLHKDFTNDLRDIKKGSIRLIVKADSDGTWGYPVPPNYLRSRPVFAAPLNILRHIKWAVPNKRFTKDKIEHVELSDALIIESPGAAANAAKVLLHWKHDNLIKRINFVPNPIPPIITDTKVAQNREKSVIAVGRWTDSSVKNTDMMLAVISKFLETNQDYTVKIIGPGISAQMINKYVEHHVATKRLLIFPEMDYQKLQKHISKSRIMLVPSMFESFCFVAAEALCSGSSIVTTPIESLIYLAGGGKWGTISKGFKEDDLLSALHYEVEMWEKSARSSDTISSYWCSELHQMRVAALIEGLL